MCDAMLGGGRSDATRGRKGGGGSYHDHTLTHARPLSQPCILYSFHTDVTSATAIPAPNIPADAAAPAALDTPFVSSASSSSSFSLLFSDKERDESRSDVPPSPCLVWTYPRQAPWVHSGRADGPEGV
jgi:hypothetical protein